MLDLSKPRNVNTRINELKNIYADLPENQLKLIEPSITQLVFLESQMQKLKEHIAKNGVYDTYQNGENQSGKKMSVEVQSYNSFVKAYNMLFKQFIEMLPPEKKKESKLAKFNT